jgi:hypothetical protein
MRNLVKEIRGVIDEAHNAPTHYAHTPVGMQEPTAYIRTATERSAVVTLKGDSLPGLFDANGRIRRTPIAGPSSDELNLEAVLIRNSRVANAGAHVLVYPEASKAIPIGRTGGIAFETIPGAVRNVEAALFSTIDVNTGAEVDVSARPVNVADIDWTQSVAKAVHFEIPRTERRNYNQDPEKLVAELMASITLGLSRAADEVLLSAIAATTPDAFSLASVAAQDVRFDELRALVGTAGTGAHVDESGVLRAAGVPADLTPDNASTIVGAFDRASIAIRDDVIVIFNRIGTDGVVSVTAWASFLPLVPDADKFWVAP